MSNYFDASGTIGFTCDNCGRELQGCTWVNGMRFCAKCYQETFGNTNPFEKELRDKISDLEAKLAESQDTACKHIAELTKIATEKDKQIEELKQQLAEKNKEITKLKSDNHALMSDNAYQEADIFEFNSRIEQLQQQLAEKEQNNKLLEAMVSTLPEHDKELEEIHNQDKISFAIQQLEKVKELMRNIDMPNKPELYNNDMFGAGFDSHYIRVEKLIDNQINVLRNNKDGIH